MHLTVADLERSLDYYREAIGLERARAGDGRAGSARASASYSCSSKSPARGPRTATPASTTSRCSLPERVDLARWLAHAGRDDVPLVGLSDHFVSEAIYLRDPDGHGIEIYWDRPREVWEGQVVERMTTLPLDVARPAGELADPVGAVRAGCPPAPSWATCT